MNLNRLHTFVTVVRLGTYAAAAEELSLTPSAVSQQMTKLETEIGATLLRRRPTAAGRTVELTEAGRRLYAHAVTISTAVDEARSDLATLGSTRAHRLRLGSFAAATISLLPPALQRLRSRLPLLHYEILEYDACKSMRRRGVDLALCARVGERRPLHDPAVTAVCLARAPILVALPPAHPLAVLDEIPVAALDGQTVHGSRRLPEVAAVVAHCEARGVRPCTTATNVTHPMSLLALVAAGDGLALVPPVLDGHPGARLLRPLADGPLWEMFALRLSGPSSLTTRAMLEEIRAIVGARPALRAPAPFGVPFAA